MQNLIEKLGLGERTMSTALWVGLSVVLLLVVLALAVWLLRALRPSLNMGGGQGRGGRPQRLAVTDAFSLDRDGRRLVIIRRDNIEHLLLIGGPNDVLVESNITRAERNPRDRTPRSTDVDAVQAAETALLGDGARVEPMLAPQPTPVVTAPSVLPPFRPATAQQQPLRPAPPPPAKPPAASPPQPAPAPRAAVQEQPASSPQRLDDDFERALAAMQATQRQQAARQQAHEAPAPAARQPAPRPLAPPPALPVAAPSPPPIEAPVAPPAPARSEPMSDMARRLNEVLQKPLSGQLRPPFNKPIPPVPPVTPAAPAPLPAQPSPPEMEALLAVENSLPTPKQPPIPAASASTPPPAAKPASLGSDHEMDLLEEEMARLLGRPAQPARPEKP